MPFFYITFHGGIDPQTINTIYKYDFNGRLVSPGTFLINPPIFNELRGMYIQPRKLDPFGGKLYVINAFKGDSFVAEFSRPDNQGNRLFIRKIATTQQIPYLIHPYDLTRLDGVFFHANQDTNSITAQTDKGVPIINRHIKATRGTFAILPSTPRGIDVNPKTGFIYVASEKTNSVIVISAYGKVKGSIEVATPIGIHIDVCKNLLFVGSFAGRSVVYAFKLDSSVPKQPHQIFFEIDLLSHPAGLITFRNSLFVLSQINRKLLEFDIKSGKFLRVVIDNLPDNPEAIAISN